MAVNFNAILEEFKRTNWQDPGTWHIAPKLVVLVVVQIGLGYGGRDSGTAASLHVPNGVLIFGLSIVAHMLLGAAALVYLWRRETRSKDDLDYALVLMSIAFAINAVPRRALRRAATSRPS